MSRGRCELFLHQSIIGRRLLWSAEEGMHLQILLLYQKGLRKEIGQNHLDLPGQETR